MPKNKTHNSNEDFQRYLSNQMTEAERNAFEREMQKAPFEAEALEGMQQFSAEEIQKDLDQLSKKIAQKKKRNTPIWAVAATILLLFSVGIIWFQLRDTLPLPEMAEIKTTEIQQEKSTPENETETPFPEIQKQEKAKPEEPVKIKESEKITPRAAKTVKPMEDEISLEFEDSNTEESFPQQAVKVAKTEENAIEEPVKMAAAKVEKSAEPKAPVVIRGVSTLRKTSKAPDSDSDAVQFSQVTNSALNEGKVIRGKVISLEDSLPLAGVIITEKGTSNGTVSDMDGTFTLQLTNKNDSALIASFIGMENTEFHPTNDSVITVGLEASQLALDEVVSIAYGVSGEQQETENIQAPKPIEGMAILKKSLKENAILPENYSSKKEVVKVRLLIATNGEIKNIENKNNAAPELFEKAKQLIFNGPKWKAKTINGMPVESELTLRIVFKKDKQNE